MDSMSAREEPLHIFDIKKKRKEKKKNTKRNRNKNKVKENNNKIVPTPYLKLLLWGNLLYAVITQNNSKIATKNSLVFLSAHFYSLS